MKPNLFAFLGVFLFIQLTGQTQNSFDRKGYPFKVIQNNYLKVSIYVPDSSNGYYRSTRFDWSGIIGQVEYSNHTFFKSGEITEGLDGTTFHDPLFPDAATGTAEEFRDPLGYDDGKRGTHFLKIGVGILERIDDKPYHWSANYKVIEQGKWTVKAAPDKITFLQTMSTEFGYAYEYEKTIVLNADSPELTIYHKLKNIGARIIKGNPYCHNFFQLDHQNVGSDYVLEFPGAIYPIDDFKNKLFFRNNKLSPTSELVTGEWVGGHINSSTFRSYTLSNTKSKTSVEIISDVDLGPFYIIMFKQSFSVEPMVLFEIKPGESFNWDRTYRFTAPVNK